MNAPVLHLLLTRSLSVASSDCPKPAWHLSPDLSIVAEGTAIDKSALAGVVPNYSARIARRERHRERRIPRECRLSNQLWMERVTT